VIKTLRLFLITSAFALIVIQPSYSQFYPLFSNNYPDSKSELGFVTDYFIGSDAVTVEFQNTYLNDNFIDNELKNKSFDKMDDRSVLGSGLNSGFYFKKSMADKENKSWYASVRHRQHYNSNYTSDLFGLYFYGNKPYAGETADLSDLNYLNLRYNQLQFGFITSTVKEDMRWDFMYGFSALLGQEYLDIKTGRGTFYTQPDGEYIEMDMLLESKQSDSTNTGFGSVNGLGASIDFMAQLTKEGKYHLRFGISDAGFISWNSNSTSFTVDTLYNFEGTLVENFFDSLFLDIQPQDDFSDSFKKDRKQEGFTAMIPLKLNVAYGRILSEKLTVWASADYIVNADYVPLFQLRGDYLFSSRFMGGASVRYGGYAELGVGLHLGVDFGKGIILQGGTSYLLGYINSSSSTAQGATIGLRKIF
jgi:uncharacterized protein DUF5723